MFRRRPRIEAPENVRIEFEDGRIVPCELVYEGWVDGAHRWKAVTPVAFDGAASLRADKIPPKTAIVLGWTR